VARNELFAAEHEDILRAIREGTPPRVTGEAGLQVLQVAETAIAQLAGSR
jgi:predicted dehydrogenase